MTASLTPCTACRRHARADEPACPFCGGALSPARPFATVDTRGLSRAAVISLAASFGLLGCVGDEVAVYGAPAPDPSSYAGGGGASTAGQAGAAGEGGGGGMAGLGGDAAGGDAGAGGK